MAEIYQMRARVRRLSPIIFRRILIQDDSSLTDLHYTLQILFGWSDTYLHQFQIHGKRYGVSRPGGMWFPDNPNEIQLKSFRFRLKEKFMYEYNFFDHWEIEIRIEKVLPVDTEKTYPLCIEGRRSGPPEDCGGPWAFMTLKDKYSLWYIEDRLLEIITQNELDYHFEEVNAFKYWLTSDKFNRQRTNRWLMQYSQGIDDWMFEMEEV